mmetsp:Transcript_50479/g.114989  ORF Transcript_50479/g.114989 Transcript_50479/m.114989 type:complete len:380 (+) Transcript_50479:2-1141(+)
MARASLLCLVLLCVVSHAAAFSVGLAPRGFLGRAVRAERRAPRASTPASPWKMQVWSNNEAIQEYRDLLAGKRQDDTNDGPSVIIGDGRLGTMLRNAGGNSGDVIVKRGDAIPEELADGVTDFPLYVCVPEHEVEAVIKACPQSKLDDLVFCQKGNIELLLKKYALCGNDNTQMLPYFSIFSKESRPMSELEDMGKDSFGSPKYAGETVIVGKWKGALAQRLDRIQLPSQPRGYLDYRRSMIEHTVFESVYNLVGLLHKGIPLGEVGLYHQKECEDMIHEMHRALRGSMAVTLLSGVEGRCKALSQNTNVEMRKPKLGEFMWYNGFFYKISLDCKEFEVYGKKVDMPDPMSMHSEYLEYARDNNLIDKSVVFEPYRVSY